VAAAIDANDRVMVPVAAINDWLRRVNRTPSHLLARLKRKHPDITVETCPVHAGAVTLQLRCYVMTIPGVTGQIEAAQMAVTVVPPSARQAVH
jgi:hypothetical protein